MKVTSTERKIYLGAILAVLFLWGAREYTSFTYREEAALKVAEAEKTIMELTDSGYALREELEQVKRDKETALAQAKASAKASKKTRIATMADGSKIEEYEEHAEQMEEHLLALTREFETREKHLTEAMEREWNLRHEAEQRLETEQAARIAAESKKASSGWGMFGLGLLAGGGIGYGVTLIGR